MTEPLTVEIGAPTGARISPDLWGLFLEDINDALDGGLNAELVRNGDFEFSDADREGWGPLTAWRVEGEGSVRVRSEDPVHPNNARYVRAVGPVTLTNEGFDEIRVTAGRTFALTAFTWRVHGVGEVAARIVGEDGGVLAHGELVVLERGWNAVRLDLVAGGSGRGRLVLVVPEGLQVELDVVSLRPVGDDGEVVTFRPDLLEALRDLHPSFVRFPGGCVAHGLGLANAYGWKPSVGPRHERAQTFNTWGYHQSRQIGYLEYFQLCEAVGASPMPIVAAGVCCQNLRGRASAIPLADMPAYVQDVLDLVEFANGATDTVWGARRAALGHPEPFGVRYLGVGNEDEITPDFAVRYAMLEDALREHHPEIVVIGTAGPQAFGPDWEKGWALARERGTAVVDEHAYRTPRWFHQNLGRYDSYDREGSAVYFGEYAARTNRVRSALAEAAFMVAMERNGDVVRLASYAPLLARVGHTQWVPDLIHFDADRVLPSASYHVQQVFAQERGSAVHAVRVEGAEPVPLPAWTGGSVRLRAPGAHVRVHDVVVDGEARADVVVDGMGGYGGDAAEATLGPIGADAVVELAVTRERGTEGVTIALGGTGADDHVEIHLGGWENKSTSVDVVADGISNDVDGPHLWHGVLTGVPARVRIELVAHHLRVLVDGELRHDHVLDRRPEHRVVAGAAARVAADGGGEQVVRLVNATDVERACRVVAAPGAGLGDGEVTARLTVLAGAGPDDGEPGEESPVRPVGASATGVGGVDVVLPPWSLVVAVLAGAGAAAGAGAGAGAPTGEDENEDEDGKR